MGKLVKQIVYTLTLTTLPLISQAQCLSGNCYAIADASSVQICAGNSITLTAEGGSAALYNDFNTQTVGNGWLTNNVNVMFNNPCGAAGIDGTPYLWFGNTAGAGQRLLTTMDFDMSGGGTIAFDLRFSIQGQASPCEGPDLVDEGVYLQYSINYGATWNTINYFDPMGGTGSQPTTTWSNYIFAIPAAAQTPCTRFRWFQSGNSGAANDHWGLDNIFIGGPPPTPGTVTFQWLDGVAANAPRTVTPTDDTDYILMYGNSSDTCFDTVKVVVHDVPVAALSVNPLQTCLGSPTQFDASASTSGTTPVVNYKWIFNNSNIINQTTTTPTTTFNYPVTGTFNTSVIVTAGICIDTATVQVTVSVPPVVNFTSPQQVCTDAEINLDASGTTIASPGTIVSFEWDYGNDGSVDETGVNGTTSSAIVGNFPIKLTVTSGAGCAASLVRQVGVLEIPQVDFTFNDACIGAVTQFQNITEGTVTQWAWDFSGTGLSAAENPSHVFPGAGIYSVGLVANNGNICYDTAEATLEIKNTVTANFSFNDPCDLMGIFADLSAIPPTSDGNISDWDWSFGDGVSSMEQNPVNQYATNGLYQVRLIVSTDVGCLDTLTLPVNKYAKPEANFGMENVCFGQISEFLNLSTVQSGNLQSSNWQFGDGQSSIIESPSYSYDTFGMFPVTLTVETEYGCRDTITQDYEVYPQPVADYSANPGQTDMLSPDVQFTDLSTFADTWAWSFGNTGSASDQNPLYTFTAAGSYDVTLVASNQYGCKASITYPYEVLPAYNFYVPAAFTPFNGDAVNEYFRIYHTGIKEINFMIFSSWGEELLYTQDPDFLWDGKRDGKKLPQGTYVYRALIRDVEGKQYEYAGHFILLY